MRYRRHLYRREEVLAEVTPLRIIPGKGVLEDHHEVMKKLSLFRPEEVAAMHLIERQHPFLGVSAYRRELWRFRTEFGHIREGVADNITDDAVFLGNGGDNRTNFDADRFILLLREDRYLGRECRAWGRGYGRDERR